MGILNLQNIRQALARNSIKDDPSSTTKNSYETSIRSHACSFNIHAELDSSINGLTIEEATRRLKVYGENVPLAAALSTWSVLLYESVFNCFNALLAVDAIISVAVPDPDWQLFIIIMVVIVVSGALNFGQEVRSSIACRSSQVDVLASICVRRQLLVGDSEEFDLEREKLVRGDILSLSAGDIVPADCIVLESSNLSVSQSRLVILQSLQRTPLTYPSLTGEGEPQCKMASYGGSEIGRTTVFDLQNVLFCGSNVMSGNGVVVIFSTGGDTFISSIMKTLNRRRPLNSFQEGIRKICYLMTAFMITSFIIVLAVKGLRTSHWQQAVVFAISTAATLVPELLPAIVTTNLARGTFVLSRKNVIVRHMQAVQNLGSMSVLCSDKTGTLTKDDIELCHYLDSSGQTSSRILQLATTNAYHQMGNKNAIDSAILEHSFSLDDEKDAEMGVRLGEIPFSFEARRSSCIVQCSTGNLLVCKGAFEEVLALCSRIRCGSATERISEQQLLCLNKEVAYYNAQAYRVVLVATREISNADMSGNTGCYTGLDNDMTIEGFLTFLDPLKDDAKASVTRLQELGVDVRILTGDNLGVAISVSRNLDLGQQLDEDQPICISGPDLAKVQDPDEFNKLVKHCKLYAKLTPAQKGQVIESLQSQGEVVGMVGDGINDAIALNTADVGISVHTGANIAKQSADIILREKELSKIIDAVTIGRITHGNIMKYIKLILAANFGSIISVLIASIWFPFDPISPSQMVLQNLLYDLSQIAIPFDNVDPEYLVESHKLSVWDLLRFILCIGPVTSTIDIGTFFLNVYYYGLGSSGSDSGIREFQCNWFIQGLISQTLVVYIARTTKIPFLQGHPSTAVVLSTLLVSGIGFAIPYIPPFARALNLVHPEASFVGILVAFLVLYAAVMQIAKMVYIRIWNRWL
ncbi:magnesium-translocating P-type ATPase [Diplocarpon rosae]|nr:magnesium-translocating P-type ATPase [Diplocarpon rosae]